MKSADRETGVADATDPEGVPDIVDESEENEDGESTDENARAPRLAKRQLLARVAHETGIPYSVATKLYEEMIAQILASVGEGIPVTLTGFGRFYAQGHKGHRVQFADQDGSTKVNNYAVLKFSATSAVNRKVYRKVGPSINDETPAQQRRRERREQRAAEAAEAAAKAAAEAARRELMGE
ncbi:DNA-binding protein [Plantibacter flavus]|uniref:DNA-binding protein n=1 Tax=Plantibacter flavus TaxID=150123 RepID=A0A3N2BLD1_9MICO|nr:HU family DNA-binding protein [Plantibacter flavus]ROR75982.1 DNA-binding protein [Plantibacter flavus]SMG49624.1 DNA-binding protein [Plantibacter flavus]